MKKGILLFLMAFSLFILVGCGNNEATDPEPVIETNPRIEEIVASYADEMARVADGIPSFAAINLTAGHGYEIVLTYVLSDDFIDEIADGDIDVIVDILDEGDIIDGEAEMTTLANIFMRDYDLETLRMTLVFATEDDTELSRSSYDFDIDDLEPTIELIGIGLTTEDVLSLIEDIETFDHLQTFELENMTVNTLINEDGNIRMFTYYLNGDDYITAVAFRLDDNARHSVVVVADDMISEITAHLYEALPMDLYGPLLRGNETFGEYRVFLVICTSEIAVEDLPWTVDEVGQFEATSMVADEEVMRQIAEYTMALEFGNIVDLAEDYIANNDPTEDDVAHDILAAAQRGVELVASVDIVVDDFNGDITIYYSGVQNITNDINIVPFIRPGRNITFDGRGTANLHITMGFYRDGWVFFDRTELRRADGSFWESNHNSWDTVRDVISGGTIRETITVDWSFAHTGTSTNWLYQRMDTGYDHMLRFRDRRDDVNYDRSLSVTEVSAMMTIGELFQIMGYLADDLPRNH
ncbi:MAG: hypothetical protein FWE07_04675 [Turicibacter sp.]|nr:hypothetical protein [Turicibacter sp.]